jgi:hypothetical protein
MERYSKFRPTGFDQNIDIDRSDWFVAPVSRNRDSNVLTESNWQAQIESLTEVSGDESETDEWEIHRFGHWGCGWLEIVIVRPDTAAFRAADDIETALMNYPVLNDEDLSQREWDAAVESWNNWGAKEFREALAEQFGLSENTVYRLDDIPDDALWELHSEYSPYGYETHNDGPHFDFRYVETDERFSRAVLAKFLNDTRPKPKPREVTEVQLHFARL